MHCATLWGLCGADSLHHSTPHETVANAQLAIDSNTTPAGDEASESAVACVIYDWENNKPFEFASIKEKVKNFHTQNNCA